MGLDYRYVFLLKRDIKDKFLKYIEDNGEINESNCLLIEFEIDKHILVYMNEWFKDIEPQHRVKFLSDNKLKVGCIYYEYLLPESLKDFYILTLVAATTDMSILFSESENVKNKMFVIGEFLDASLVYLDMEYKGRELISFNSQRISITIRDKDEFMKMINYKELFDTFTYGLDFRERYF